MCTKEYGNFTERGAQAVCYFKLYILQVTEKLYARVRHIIAMNQGTEMLNAV